MTSNNLTSHILLKKMLEFFTMFGGFIKTNKYPHIQLQVSWLRISSLRSAGMWFRIVWYTGTYQTLYGVTYQQTIRLTL